MNSIKFSEFWDKLNDPEFTTIRSFNPSKLEYYESLKGEKFQVWKADPKYPFRKEHVICHAYLKGIVRVTPRELAGVLLSKDVTLHGEIKTVWIDKLLAMDSAIMLIFSSSPVPSQKKLKESP